MKYFKNKNENEVVQVKDDFSAFRHLRSEDYGYKVDGKWKNAPNEAKDWTIFREKAFYTEIVDEDELFLELI